MLLLFGLGNMDKKYEGTRHNIGFQWADALADRFSASFSKGKGPYWIAKARYKGRNFGIIKPTTYMNLSGKAVQSASSYYDVPLQQCLICYDDLNLPVGTIRLRPNGSHGGHNGIKSIIEEVHTREFPRLRIGIGNDFPRGRQVQYVLSAFSKKEEPEVQQALRDAREASLCFIHEGIEMAMNYYN